MRWKRVVLNCVHVWFIFLFNTLDGANTSMHLTDTVIVNGIATLCCVYIGYVYAYIWHATYLHICICNVCCMFKYNLINLVYKIYTILVILEIYLLFFLFGICWNMLPNIMDTAPIICKHPWCLKKSWNSFPFEIKNAPWKFNDRPSLSPDFEKLAHNAIRNNNNEHVYSGLTNLTLNMLNLFRGNKNMYLHFMLFLLFMCRRWLKSFLK